MRAMSFYRAVLALLVLMSSIYWVEAQVSAAAATGSITGTVIDPQGAVILGAQVTATYELTKAQYTTRIDATGFYRFSDLASGDYSVRFSSQGFKSETKTVVVTSSTDTRLDVKLAVVTYSGPEVNIPFPVIAVDSEPLQAVALVGGIAGRVVDRRGRAISGVRITVTSTAGDTSETATGSNGAYILSDLPAGSYSVRLEATGFQPETKTGVQVSLSTVTRLHSKLKTSTVSPEPAASSGSIAGEVLDPPGAVVSGAKVHATNELSKRQYTTKSDATGEYRLFGLASGLYSVSFFSLGFEVETQSSVAVSTSKITQLNVRLTAGTVEFSEPVAIAPKLITSEDELERSKLIGGIAGKVVDRSEVAIPGAEVTVINTAGDAVETVTNRDGEYLVSDLPGGDYRVRLETTKFHRAQETKVQVVPSQVTRLDAKL